MFGTHPSKDTNGLYAWINAEAKGSDLVFKNKRKWATYL